MTNQYRTIVDGAGWIETPPQGLLRFAGPDAASFLHALVTNDVEGVSVGRGVHAAWLTPQGRMITDLRLLRDDTGVRAIVPAELAPALQARFDQLIFSEDVRVTDESAAWASATCVGGRAADAVAGVTGAPADILRDLPINGHVTHDGTLIVRTDETALPTFRVSGRVFSTAPKKTLPETFFHALRIDAGRPLFGVDMTTETIPLEAGLLDRAISQTKGCYVGQEVIVRILHRGGGRVVKHLMKLEGAEGVEVPPAGATLSADGRDVGVVTSAAESPSTGRPIALGYVHRDSAAVGASLTLSTGQTMTITAFAG